MKCLIIILVIHYSTSHYIPVAKQPKSPCDSASKNSLIEHFFNIIFSEFHTSPPVCVCVQMCAGQSTYCYPNGCLRRDDVMRVDSPQAAPQATRDRRQYMFVVDEKNDFMKDFLEKSYSEESVTVSPESELRDIRLDVFKDKYSMLIKNKRMPNVELRYNLREQVKNMKSDLLRLETGDLSKTRWPTNKRNLMSGHKVNSKLEKRTPIVGKANFFMAMLPSSEVAGYPPKYFKRDIAESVKDSDANVKEIYLLENAENNADINANETISLETLIENLISNSFRTKHNTNNDTTNTLNSKLNDANNKAYDFKEKKGNKTEEIKHKNSLNSNETLTVVSINSINETVDKNKYTEDSISNSSNIFKEMIINLSKRIEKQNNTSLEIAKRLVGDFNEEETTMFNMDTTLSLSYYYNETAIDNGEVEISDQITVPTTDTTEIMATMKNRQKRARRFNNKNTQ